MQKPGTIGTRQFTILVTLITVGDSILILPAAVAKEASYDSWLSSIIGVLVGLAVIYLYCIISRLHQEHTLIGKNILIFGRWLGTALSIMFLFTLLINGSVYVRAIGDFMTAQILKETPSVAVVILLVACSLFGVRLGLETFARTSEIFYLWFVFTFLSFFLVGTTVFPSQLAARSGKRACPSHQRLFFCDRLPVYRADRLFNDYPFRRCSAKAHFCFFAGSDLRRNLPDHDHFDDAFGARSGVDCYRQFPQLLAGEAGSCRRVFSAAGSHDGTDVVRLDLFQGRLVHVRLLRRHSAAFETEGIPATHLSYLSVVCCRCHHPFAE